MRVAILSDLHANREAFLEVEKRLDTLRIDRVFFLGDAVGYNADPDFCAKRISSLANAAVRGNHDKAVVELKSLEWFNSVAREAILWTRNSLSEEGLRLVGAFPIGPVAIGERYVLCHGSPMDEDLYIVGQQAVKESFLFLHRHYPQARLCFFGHTHVPVIIEERGRALRPPQRFELDPNGTYLINPGSVGQPRDRVPLASFGVLDEEELAFEYHRVPYPIIKTQAKILAAGLPSALAERLAGGW